MFHPSIRPVVNTLLHTIPLDLHRSYIHPYPFLPFYLYYANSDYAHTLLKTVQDISTASYPSDQSGDVYQVK